MYQVVLFIVSNEVECVPVAWLKSETQVYWPDGISLSVQQRAIREAVSPNKLTWNLYDVRCLKNGLCSKCMLSCLIKT